jgi:DNA-binding NarL/FixJ family response regulator
MEICSAAIRVVVVDDYEPWRRFASNTLQQKPKLRIVGEASDGLRAVQIAQQLQPDLILLDIGLPQISGIEVARLIKVLCPSSKILFMSENRSWDIAQEALSTGAGGYVVKSDAASELLPAVKAVLEGNRYISASLAGHQSDYAHDPKKAVTPFRAEKRIRHEVEFYADDAGFVNGFARFIEVALKAENAVIVIATESHQASLLQRLAADGFDVPTDIKEGRYVPFEVTSTVSSFMVNGWPDPVRFRKLAIDLITKAAEGANEQSRCVVVCGEGVHTLLAAGNVEATIKLERMWNEIAQPCKVDILCGYFRSAFAEEDISTLERVCAEHTAARGRELGY